MKSANPWIFIVLFITSLSCTRKTTLFTKLSPEITGIDFANTLVENDSFNVLTFEYIYNGGGVGVGDFNNDGLPDLYFTGNKVSGKLYLNEGNCIFKDVTFMSNTATHNWCTGVAVIDINADGWQDIYISAAFTNQEEPVPNLLFINQGLNKQGVPVFSEAAALVGLNDSSYGTQAAFFDFDLDGDLDVYLCINSGRESDRNRLRRQQADGSGISQDKLFRNEGISTSTSLPYFTDVSKQAGIRTEGWGLGIVVKDINRDGWPDVYVANDFQSNDHLYINNGNGTFTNKIEKYLAHQCHNAMGVDMADCNNDGLEDIVVVDMLPDDNLRQKTMFGAVPNDKYKAAFQMGYQPQFVRNVLQLNNGLLPDSTGSPAFSDIGYMAGIAATDWSWSPLWADFDMDGWRDLLITNGYVKDITNLDFATYASEYRMFGSDKNKMKDLQKRMREMGEVRKRNWLFVNNKDLTFSDKSRDWGLPDESFSNGAAYADLDNDGDLDIIMNNLNDPAFIYRNNSRSAGQSKTVEANNYIQFKLRGNKKNSAGIGAKIMIWHNNTIQYAEQALQRGYLSSMDERVHFGLGLHQVIDSLLIEWPSGKTQKLFNIPANQMQQLAESSAADIGKKSKEHPPSLLQSIPGNMNLSYLHEENDYLDFLYQYTLPHRYSLQGPSLAVADINGDGLEDFYSGGSSRHSGYFFIQTPAGFTQRPFSADASKKLQEETGTLLFDADNDGDNDLYCVAGGNEFGDSAAYQDLLYLNDGKGNFTNASQALPNTSAGGSSVAGADFDHDGDIDLFIGGRNKPHQYPLPGRSYLLRNDSDPKSEKILFTDVTTTYCYELAQPGMVTSALWTDYNNDGFADLLIAGEFMPLELYKNDQGKRFTKLAVAAFKNTNGWYNSLAAGDFDNDGDMDYVAGNLGLNSRYKASVNEPVTARWNDFDNDGALDAFLFAYNDNKEYPTQTRNVITDQIATLKKKAYYYYDYGKMGYNDLFTAHEKKGAKELRAFQMKSVYIENSGNGIFSVKPLPVMAQISPMFGIQPVDADNDGNLDIVAVGNSYAPEALTGRYDASVGWVLLGNGKGAFLPVSPQQSGFVVSGDAKALTRINKNNDSCLLIASQNSGFLKVHALKEIDKCIPLLPEDVYVLYQLKNGKKRKEEAYYGSSYLSQSGRFIMISDSIDSVQIFSANGRQRKLIE